MGISQKSPRQITATKQIRALAGVAKSFSTFREGDLELAVVNRCRQVNGITKDGPMAMIINGIEIETRAKISEAGPYPIGASEECPPDVIWQVRQMIFLADMQNVLRELMELGLSYKCAERGLFLAGSIASPTVDAWRAVIADLRPLIAEKGPYPTFLSD